jgi:glutamate-1-semialdehyde 2,1-aminomutase
MVTYGKTLGGGLPVGVCAAARPDARFRDDRPADICFARGTFNSHPYVMGSDARVPRHGSTRRGAGALRRISTRAGTPRAALNAAARRAGLPVRVANLSSIWTVLYTQPSRYNWMLQFYLRAQAWR